MSHGPIGYIYHHLSNKLVHPSGGSSNPPNGTNLVLHDAKNAPERLRLQFIPWNVPWNGEYGYIKHVESGKIVHPKCGRGNPENRTELVYHSDQHEGALFKFDVANKEIIHIKGKKWHPRGGLIDPANDTVCVLHSDTHAAAKFFFGDIYGNPLSPYTEVNGAVNTRKVQCDEDSPQPEKDRNSNPAPECHVDESIAQVKKGNLSEDDLKQEVSDVLIGYISRSFCMDLQQLYPHLDLEKVVAEDAEREKDEVDKMIAFYTEWSKQKGSKATYRKLIWALLKIERRENAEKVCKILAENLGKMEPEEQLLNKLITVISSTPTTTDREPMDPLDSTLDDSDTALIKPYIKRLQKNEVVDVGVSLGLAYTRLSDVVEDRIHMEMISRWLGKQDHVEKITGTPTWRKLVKALRDNGQNGVADEIEREKS